jgi:hypothetical protein
VCVLVGADENVWARTCRRELDGGHRRRQGPAGGGRRERRHRLPGQVPAQEGRPRHHPAGGGSEGEERRGKEETGRAQNRVPGAVLVPRLLPPPQPTAAVVVAVAMKENILHWRRLIFFFVCALVLMCVRDNEKTLERKNIRGDVDFITCCLLRCNKNTKFYSLENEKIFDSRVAHFDSHGQPKHK